jgi:hypothetical protein
MTVAEKPRASKLSESLSRHPGKWVAIKDDEVVDSADTLEALREQTQGRSIDSVLKVPHEKRAGGVFL